MGNTNLDCFFYGTLMNPKILSSVIGRSSDTLIFKNAVLPEHTRHHIAAVDYPGVVPLDIGKEVMKRDLTTDESCVRGALVQGLKDGDLEVLDEFEGDEYVRKICTIFEPSDATNTRPANVYIFDSSPLTRLLPSLWSYDTFVRDNLRFWVSPVSPDEGEDKYGEVVKRMAVGAKITLPEMNGEFEEFGRALGEKYWSFEKGYINLNHGSFGTCPKPVVEAFRKYQDMAEAAPDKFFRRGYISLLNECQEQLADLIDCDAQDLVMVPNATTGVYTAIHSIPFSAYDYILYFPTVIYSACANILHHLLATHPDLSLSLLPVPLKYPLSHAQFLELLREALEKAKREGKKVKCCVLDAISSQPGVRVPWEEACGLLREFGVLSVVDAAHAVGQVAVSLRKAQPDFWVSNAHKWLYVHRGCALMYVSRPLQSLVHSVPIGHGYPVPPTTSSDHTPSAHSLPGLPTPSTFQTEFAWVGTQDFSSICAVPSALAFRRKLGGERRIMEWCEELARQGGRVVSGVLGTEVMESEEGELTCGMVNVRLPVAFEAKRVKDRVMEGLWEEWNCAVAVYPHDNKWFVRLSVQVYNDAEDFKIAAEALKTICERIAEEPE